MKIIYKKTGLIFLVVIFFTSILWAGCLGSSQQPPKMDITQIKCSQLLEPGQNLIINETQNNSTICAKRNSMVTIRLNDASRLGNEWVMTATPGLQVSDEGVTWFSEPDIPPGSLIEYGIHEWNVTVKDNGLQSINASLLFYGGKYTQEFVETFNLTIFAE